jgi:hypothetical protein
MNSPMIFICFHGSDYKDYYGVKPFNPVECCQCFRGTCSLHLLNCSSILKMEEACSSETVYWTTQCHTQEESNLQKFSFPLIFGVPHKYFCKLIPHLVMKFSAFNRTQRFITVFTKVSQIIFLVLQYLLKDQITSTMNRNSKKLILNTNVGLTLILGTCS